MARARQIVFESCNLSSQNAAYILELFVFQNTFVNLMHLNLGNNNLNEHALISFSTLLQQSKEIPKLTILQLHNNRLVSPPILASIIKELNTLLVLNLSGIGFQDRGIEILASSISHKNRIEYLDLSNNFLTDTGLQSICDNFHQN